MRRGLQYITQSNFRGGINQEPSSAQVNQVLDARNVYIDEKGDLVKRPGSRLDRQQYTINTITSWTNPVLSIGSNNYSFGVTDRLAEFNDLDNGDFIYLGFDNVPSSDTLSFKISLTSGGTASTLANANSTRARVEYWDGTSWKSIESRYFEISQVTDIVFDAGGVDVSFCGFLLAYIPSDFALLEINTDSRYWLRVQFFGDETGSGKVFDLTGDLYFIDAEWSGNLAGAKGIGKGNFELANNKYRVDIRQRTSNGDVQFRDITGTQLKLMSAPSSLLAAFSEPPTLVAIPEANKTYVAYANTVYDLDFPGSTVMEAEVNSEPSIIGDEDGVQENDATYDIDTIAQLNDFPRANYLLYFKSFLWAAGIDGKPFEVRWSASALDGATDVWPEVSFATLSEDDNSPITGLASLNEHTVVFKRDSIWIMVFSGFNELGLAQFNATKVVSGLGCVSQASIQNVNGKLIFLAEDGFYSFNGTPAVQKLSELIDEQVSLIKPARKRFSNSVHWRSKNLYMCAASVDNDTENDFIFVYDYKNGGWWFWEDLSVQSWLRDEGAFARETITYGDPDGRIFELTDNRRTDAGAPITLEMLSHRLGYGDSVTKRWRDLRLHSTNSTEQVTTELLRYDEEQGEATILLTDSTEAKWDTAVWDTDVWVKDKRRERAVRVRETSEWCQVKFSASNENAVELHGYSLGNKALGKR